MLRLSAKGCRASSTQASIWPSGSLHDAFAMAGLLPRRQDGRPPYRNAPAHARGPRDLHGKRVDLPVALSGDPADSGLLPGRGSSPRAGWRAPRSAGGVRGGIPDQSPQGRSRPGTSLPRPHAPSNPAAPHRPGRRRRDRRHPGHLSLGNPHPRRAGRDLRARVLGRTRGSVGPSPNLLRREGTCSDPQLRAAMDEILGTLTAPAPRSPYALRVSVGQHATRQRHRRSRRSHRGLPEVSSSGTHSPEELAGVLAHELQHVLRRHATRAMFQERRWASCSPPSAVTPPVLSRSGLGSRASPR